MAITLEEGQEVQLNVQLNALPPELARLWGHVTDAVTQAPIAGALIQLIGAYQYSATTDSTGYYEIPEIIPGVYSGEVTANGYEPYAF
jgi:hypothetical protein